MGGAFCPVNKKCNGGIVSNVFFDPEQFNWYLLRTIANRNFVSGFCGHLISRDRGYKVGRGPDGEKEQYGGIYICSNCQDPTFFTIGGEQYPSPAIGKSVMNVPAELNDLYEEARRCTSQNCHTAAVLLCRKMLINIAVEQGAQPGKQFIEYVNFLSDKGYTPPNGKHWVDHIRKKGNEATHEIVIMGDQDAKDLLIFTEMLLRFIYEFPNMVPLPKKPNA